MDEIGISALIITVTLSIGTGFIISFYPFDFTMESEFSSNPMPEYDYIIVGGGTAGSVLANRLSEDSSVEVLLLEAGGLHNWISQVPLLCPLLQGTNLDWQYVTEPQTQSSFGLKRKISRWPRGKGLGGSSLINYMVHLRGTVTDFDDWTEESGCPEWSAQELLPYFVKSESVQHQSSPDNLQSSYDNRGHNGPLQIQQNVENCKLSGICTVFLKSVEEIGQTVGDLNGNLEFGAMPAESNVFQGRRFSVYDGYIKPVMNRSNLDIMLHVIILKILFEVGPKAVGVQLFHNHRRFEIKCRREVILSAGSINTPLLLMMSGIGSHEELVKHKITPIAPFLPVGENLRDHLSIPLYVKVEKVAESHFKDTILQMGTAFDFLFYNKGPLIKSGVAAVARIPVPHCVTNSSDDCHHNGLLLFLLEIDSLDPNLYTRISNLEMQIFNELFPNSSILNADDDQNHYLNGHQYNDGFILLLMGTHPKSKGYVRMDDDFKPLIQPNYLDADEDVQVLSYGIRVVASLFDTPSMRSIGARLHLPKLNDCNEFGKPNLDDNYYLECWIRIAAVTAYHPVGTCRMGIDREAVVDCNLRVKGVQNLRVVDASIINPVSGSPAATVVAVAEKAAKMIALDHHLEQ